MSLLREFILYGPDQWKSLSAFLRQNAAAMAEQGKPLNVRISVHKAKRSNEQNALMWVLLGVIEEQGFVRGQRFDAEVWNLHFKRELLPEETAKGVKKWRHLPNGERELFMSTSDLDVTEMSAYLDALQAKAATELGVSFDLQPA